MRRMVLAAVALAVIGPVSALADKPDKGKGKAKHHENERQEDVKVEIHFGSHQRAVAREYFIETHGRGNCPPGQAKKHNGCLPPGQAKKVYAVGHPLPATVVVREVPPVLLTRMGPVPAGYRYVIVDGDLVKLAVGTALVVDAIEGLVR
jgi:Ni/Co efflux regulator RcnB